MECTASEFRQKCRNGLFHSFTSGLASNLMNNAQANVTIVPKPFAYDFLLFCTRNPKALPILEVLDEGNKESVVMAPKANITKDLPLYWVFEVITN